MKRQLAGQRIVVTRTRTQASKLVVALERYGATVVEVPTISIEDPQDGGAGLLAAAGQLEAWSWVVFTSPNGASRFCEAVQDAPLPDHVRLAAVGPATASIVEQHLGRVDLIPERYVGEGLVDAFPPATGKELPVLLPQAEVARPTVPEGLTNLGWTVQVVPAYRTMPATITAQDIDAISAAHMVTFTSSSTVEQFVALIGLDQVPPLVACIGPITAKTARDVGLSPHIEATEHSIDGLVAAILASSPYD